MDCNNYSLLKNLVVSYYMSCSEAKIPFYKLNMRTNTGRASLKRKSHEGNLFWSISPPFQAVGDT